MVSSARLAVSSFILIVGVAISHGITFDEDLTAALVGNWITSARKDAASAQQLVQVVDAVSDYPSCTLGNFWCQKLKDANISNHDAGLLKFSPILNNTQYFEWTYNNRPTCVAQGPSYYSCVLDSVLVCAGDSTYGRGEEQAAALKLALDNAGVHPNCPSCSIGRTMPHSTNNCLVAKGSSCIYECQEGYMASGHRVCHENGTFSGGECIPLAADTDTHEMMTPSPHPVVSPSPSPTLVRNTPQDVAHENWTNYEQTLEYESTAAYRRSLSESACLYLLDLENDFHSRGFEPRKPLRAGLFPAARAAGCAWVHDEVYSRVDERKHKIPKRGDHGPWPRILMPNIVHVRVSGEVVALNLDLQTSTGKDLYRALAERLSVASDSFTLYLGPHPIEEAQPLQPLGIKLDTVLAYSEGQQLRKTSGDSAEGAKLSWKPGAITDGDRGSIAP